MGIIKSTTRSLSVRAAFYLATHKTEKWVIHTYSALCDLDYETWQDHAHFKFISNCNYVEIINSSNVYTFALNEISPGVISCNVFTYGSWVQVYKTGEYIADFRWIKYLEELHYLLERNNVYEKRHFQILRQTREEGGFM